MKLAIPDNLKAIKPYVPGKPIEEVQREYGIDHSIKLASNENPFGPSPMAVAAIQQVLGNLHRYPDAAGYELTHSIAKKYDIDPGNIVLGNGSDDIIALLAAVLLNPADEVILPQPSFLFYEISIRGAGISPKTRMIFLNVPHNPTGTIISKPDFQDFIAEIPPQIVVVLDEAYIEFVTDTNCANSFDYLKADSAIVGMRTFSKAFGLAGLRVGYGVMPVELAELLHRVRQPFNVNTLAQVAAAAALDDAEFLKRTLSLVHDELKFIYTALDNLQISYIQSQANFLMIEISDGQTADEICEKLLMQGVIVRAMTAYGYPQHIRVTIGQHEENIRFLEALKQVI